MHYQKKGVNYSADQHYKDLDGNSKSFTIINHDPKPTLNMYNPSEQEKEEAKQAVSTYRKELQQKILAEHASLCPVPLQPTYTIRGESVESFTWNTKAILNDGISIDVLRDIAVMVEKRKELYT